MQRKSFGFVLVFFLGLALGFGLNYLDEQTRFPRLESSEIFEVALPNGTIIHLSYSELERERQELKRLRIKLARLENKLSLSNKVPIKEKGQTDISTELSPSLSSPKDKEPQTEPPKPKEANKKLGELFKKIFSQPVIKEFATVQAERQAGELAAVLDLTGKQKQDLEQILREKTRPFPSSMTSVSPAGQTPGNETQNKDLEEQIETILTPEQYRQYQEYTEKKKSLFNASPVEKDLLELTWRLDLTEDQETAAKEILQEHREENSRLSPSTCCGELPSIEDRLEKYLQLKEDLDKAMAEKMKTVLDEEQLNAFLVFQEEKDAETRLFRKLIQEEPEETPKDNL